jgi:hypothetical protein
VEKKLGGIKHKSIKINTEQKTPPNKTKQNQTKMKIKKYEK